jgi:hypothetical protein
MNTMQFVYWGVGGLVLLLAVISLYYFSCHCAPPIK